MRRKLLVFISSTYKDLEDERQAAVEAVLAAGHIPAGMELFTAGDKSQLETIKRWISDADAFLLILGGRYGSIEPTSKKSYIELEYLHATENSMPLFALVLDEKAMRTKVKKDGAAVIEQDNPDLYKNFKSTVLNKICSFVEDTKDIRLEIQRSLNRIYEDNPNAGWTPIREVGDPSKTATEMASFAKEVSELTKQNAKLEKRISELTNSPEETQTRKFLRIKNILQNTMLDYGDKQLNALWLFINNKEHFVTGIHNASAGGREMGFLFHVVGPQLEIHGLLEDYKRAGVSYRTIKTSRLGNQFLAWDIEQRLLATTKKLSQAANTSPPSAMETNPQIEASPDKRNSPHAGANLPSGEENTANSKRSLRNALKKTPTR
ncbi:DUF4062 domain-containing protein [Myxococcus sp. AM011]|uniref:DUF4062 domain-containing protein n=1 Tax=Myxococcus sp. AM011 TaxID=2745200 RepID=UPI00159635FF|nr:DUF4062 domain-containing protein [Myxococcus sp. AM011]